MYLSRMLSTKHLFLRCVLVLSLGLAQHAYGQKDVRAVIVDKSLRKPAPSFQLDGGEGKDVRLTDFRGRVVLLNFWATKCGGCILEIPSFIEIQANHANEKFTALGVSADIPYEGLKSPQEAWALVKPFVASHHMNYPVVMGSSDLVDTYGFRSYPATYLIDKKGRIAALYEGVVSKDDVEKNVKTLLSER
jgi:peroxiredoxin